MNEKLVLAKRFGCFVLTLYLNACAIQEQPAEIHLKNGADETSLFAAKTCEDQEPPDYKLAMKFYMRASNAGQPYADLKLARLYCDGLGTARDEAKVSHFCVKAFKDRIGCVNPNPLIPVDLKTQTVEILLERAKSGDPKALYYLGVCHHLGYSHLRKDIFAAAVYYRGAMAHGNGEAAFNLGTLYLDPAAETYDVEEAFACFVKASTYGCKPALIVVSKLDPEVGTFLTSNYQQRFGIHQSPR